MPDAWQIFIAPPSLEALRTRLVGRGTDDAEQVDARLRVAVDELAAQDEFAEVVATTASTTRSTSWRRSSDSV